MVPSITNIRDLLNTVTKLHLFNFHGEICVFRVGNKLFWKRIIKTKHICPLNTLQQIFWYIGLVY